MNLAEVIQRSTRALQPAATSVPIGTLYYVTDESVTERSNGTTWQTYSDTGASSAITQLTGDVTAGPGAGSQVATIAANAVGTAEIVNDAVTYAKIQTVTDARLLGRSAGSDGDAQEITVGAGLSLAAGALTASATGDWDTTIVKSVDQDVVNSTTLVDDSELQFAVLAGEGYIIELIIVYSGSDISRDFKWDVAVSAGTMNGSGFWCGLSSTDVISFAGLAVVAVADTTDQTMGTLAAQGIRIFHMRWTLMFTTNGTFSFRFAQNAAGPGLNSRCEAGSILRKKKIL